MGNCCVCCNCLDDEFEYKYLEELDQISIIDEVKLGNSINYYRGFPNNGQYLKELINIKRELIEIINLDLLKPINLEHKPYAMVFDLDDTIFFTDPLRQFYLKCKSIVEDIKYLRPIQPIVDVLHYLKTTVIFIIILTERPLDMKDSTLQNLDIYDIPYHYIHFMPECSNHQLICDCNDNFKTRIKKNICENYNVIAFVGDSINDLSDNRITRSVKLPNHFNDGKLSSFIKII